MYVQYIVFILYSQSLIKVIEVQLHKIFIMTPREIIVNQNYSIVYLFVKLLNRDLTKCEKWKMKNEMRKIELSFVSWTIHLSD